MKGLMMDYPLTVTSLMRHVEAQHGGSEVYSLTVENPAHRTTYAGIFRRAAKLANALRRVGLKQGDRVATMAWNDYRHMELYYGISCMGGVLHTINPRLFPEQLQYIVNHAEDRFLFADPLLLPLLEKLHPAFPSVEAHVLLCSKEAIPESSVPNLISYEELIEGESDSCDWPDLDENLASSLCYTSGTTGNPKGVLFSHRSTILHTYASALADAISINSTDSVLPVVPMFHANAWGVVYSAPMVGAKLVLPGPKAGDPEALAAMMNGERVTKALGVPTVWLGLLNYLDATGQRLETVRGQARAIRCSSFAGFQGRSRLMTAFATCRFKPTPPLSEERKTLQSGSSLNRMISRRRLSWGTVPTCHANSISASSRRSCTRLNMRTHSEKMMTFVSGSASRSSSIRSSSSSFGLARSFSSRI